jgi:hypothetical protein
MSAWADTAESTRFPGDGIRDALDPYPQQR